jgi:uncharacterized protein (DUF433 family)
MKLTQIIATATTAAVLGTAGISIAGATSNGGNDTKPTASAASPSGGNRAARRAHRRVVVRKALDVAASTIGIDKSDLVKELRAGKTIAEVATAHNVDPQHVVDVLVQDATKKIEAAKTAGKISAERAAKLEQRLPEVVGKLVNDKHTGKGVAHRRAAVRKLAQGGVKVAADAIGIAPKDLVKEVRAGKTIAEVATAHNVDPQKVIDALVQASTKKIEAAKTAGKISAERAAKLEEHAPARITKLVNDWHPKAGAKGAKGAGS